MKILHYISDIDLASGGPSRSMPTMCLGLKAIGIDCEVRSHKSANPNNKILEEAGIPVTLIQRPWGYYNTLWSKHLVKDGIPSDAVVHIQNIWDPALHWVADACKKQGTPYIISPRGMLEPWSLAQKKNKKRLGLFFYQLNDLKNASCIHTTAVSEMEHVRALGVKCPIAVIPNGIKVDDYQEKEYDAPRNGKKRMLFLSRIHPKKGIESLIDAFARIIEDEHESHKYNESLDKNHKNPENNCEGVTPTSVDIESSYEQDSQKYSISSSEINIDSQLSPVKNLADAALGSAAFIASAEKEIPTLETRNSTLDTRNSKLETRHSKLETSKTSFADWELVIVGNGEEAYIESLKSKVKGLGLEDCIKILPPVFGEAKTEMYQSADVFVLPTYSENFGMVIAEAMCCGVPVITTTGTPWTELKEKNLGWYIDLSVDNLKNAIAEAMNKSDEDLHDMGKRSREHILQNYSIEAVATKYKALYGWLKGENKKTEFVYEDAKKNENVLLMTATVNPNGLLDSSLQDVEIRENQYISTLVFYANQPGVDKIVFVENSGWNLEKMLQKSGVSSKMVECISLDCNNYPRELGKGYGEYQLIDKAIDLSTTLKDNDSFVKVTGRFPLLNIANMLKEFENKDTDLYCDIVNHKIYDWLHTGWDAHHGRTVVYKVSVDFYRKYFYGRYVECNDVIDHTAEWLMYDVAMSTKDYPNVKLRFKTEPRPTGRAGHHVGGLIDTNDYDDKLSKIKRGVRQVLRWTVPWLWF